MNELENAFGARLKIERIRLHFSQQKLAELTNVKPLSISQYENNKSLPSIKFIFALEKLGFDIAFIMLGIKPIVYENNIDDEVVRKTVNVLNQLELDLGENLEASIKVKLTNLLIIHFKKNDMNDESFTPIQILLKII